MPIRPQTPGPAALTPRRVFPVHPPSPGGTMAPRTLLCALALLILLAVSAPAQAAVTGQWKAVGTGQAHTCAISSDDHVSCWGLNSDHQLDIPGDLGAVRAISVGGWSTCAIEVSGSVRCWGDDYNGQADVPATLGGVNQVSVGVDNACAVRTDDSLMCWGKDDWGKS